MMTESINHGAERRSELWFDGGGLGPEDALVRGKGLGSWAVRGWAEGVGVDAAPRERARDAGVGWRWGRASKLVCQQVDDRSKGALRVSEARRIAQHRSRIRCATRSITGALPSQTEGAGQACEVRVRRTRNT